MQQYFDYNQKMAVPDKLFTPLHGVKLTGGLFRQMFDNNWKFNLTQLDIDRMRYWFDIKEGKEPTAERYPGHFEDNLHGQTASQYLMAAGNTLRWEEIPEVREGLETVLDFIEEGQEIDGFCLPIDKHDFAVREYPHYVRIWLNYALIACARAGEKRAFKMLRLWQDWFNRCPDLPAIKYLELAFQGVVASPLVYVTEVGVKEDMEVTRKYYEEEWRLGQFMTNEPWSVNTRRQHGKEPHSHGSELEAYEGYLDLYRYTGADYYLKAVKNVVGQYKHDWQHPGGGIIMCERFGGHQLGHRLIYKIKGMGYNEFCCTAFWIGINQRLHRLFPDEEQHVFELEQSLYNIAAAAQNGSEDIRYFQFLDEQKYKSDRPNHCCAGVGTRVYASLPEYLFTMNDTTLSCDIFASAELDWQTPHQTIRVTEQTDYPYDSHISLKFDMEAAQDFTLRVRIPHYVDGDVSLKLNGEEIAVGKPGSYAVIFRHWQPGDKLEFDLPFTFCEHPYVGEHDVEGYSRSAYMYGPVLLAIVGERSHENGIPVPGTPGEFTSRLRPNGKPLHFDIDGMPGYEVVPYFEIQEESFVCFPMFKK